MTAINLTFAGGKYECIMPLVNGDIKPEGINLNYVSLGPDEVFWRMLKYREFDGSEMSLGAYVILKSRGIDDLMAIPVFPSRNFRQSSIYVSADSNIRMPQDLAGGRIGMPEFQMTMAIWVRGILKNEYGLNLEDITWYLGGIDKPGRKERIELKAERYKLVQIQDRTLSDLLLKGEIDAVMSAKMPQEFVRGRGMRRLFSDYRKEEMDYYRKTKIFPIMHLIVLQKKILEKHPWIAASLYKAFEQSMKKSIERVYNAEEPLTSLVWMSDYIEQEKKFFGNDMKKVWSNGLRDNRHVIETFIKYLNEEGLLEKPVTVDELFVECLLKNYSF